MSAEEYISTGAIEACIMGFADEQDWLELEQLAIQYPEVRKEKDRVEKEVESQHIKDSMTLPPSLKNKILQGLPPLKQREHTPVVSMSNSAKNIQPDAIPSIPTPKSVIWLQRALAASVILLMGSILLNFMYYSKAGKVKKDYDALVLQQNSLLAKNEAFEASFKTIKDPAMKQVIMAATPAKPGSLATIYWNTKNKDVYLMVNKLAQPAQGKQYQLWAIVNGKPVNAGMVETKDDKMLVKMHNIPSAEAFAITLEKEGGSPAPTMDAMYVVGKV